MDRADLIANLREWQAQRTAAIRMQLRIDNQTLALIRRAMGWQWDMPEKERTKLNKQAAEVKEGVEKGQAGLDDHGTIIQSLAPFILAAQQSRQTYDEHRKYLEKHMTKAVRELPAYDWWHAIHGVGDLGLALIVGECGDLTDYPNHRHVWKRLGLSPMNGKAASTWRRKGGLSAEEWEDLGYSPKRRSVVFTIGDSLIKKQNAYRELYLERKAQEQARTDDNAPQSKMHAHLRAQRYMEKQLIKNLWRAWVSADGIELDVEQEQAA